MAQMATDIAIQCVTIQYIAIRNATICIVNSNLLESDSIVDRICIV